MRPTAYAVPQFFRFQVNALQGKKNLPLVGPVFFLLRSAVPSAPLFV